MQPLLDGGPLAVDDAEVDGMAVGSVAGDAVVAQGAFFDCAEPANRLQRACVAAVGLERDASGGDVFEGVAQEQILAFGVDAGALPGGAVPGHAYFKGAVLADNVYVGSRTDGSAGLKVKDGELDGKALCQFSGTLCDPLCGVCEAAEGRAGRIAPDRFLCASRIEICGVFGVDRLQAHQVAGQGDGLGVKGIGRFGVHGSCSGAIDWVAGGRQVVGGPSRERGSGSRHRLGPGVQVGRWAGWVGRTSFGGPPGLRASGRWAALSYGSRLQC